MKRIETYEDFYLLMCPHCEMMIMVYKNEINCGIFRCGIHKLQGHAITPHASKKECDELVEKQLIYGCGRPFKINNFYVEPCDYV
jgi:hypothetical protein